MKPILLTLSLATHLAFPVSAADWLQFRGPNGSGVATETNLSPRLEATSIQWKIALPGRGLSSPIIVGDRVFITAATGLDQERLHVFCFRAKDGAKVWERQFWATGRTMTQAKTCVAAGTPCSNGQRLFVIFSSNDLFCLDLDGNLLWLRGLTRDYPNASNSLGLASSPAFADDTLVVQVENDSESFALGIDAITGVNRWKRDRPKVPCWASPIIVADAKSTRHVAVLQSSPGISAVDVRTGEEAWYYSETAATIPSSTLVNGVLFVPAKGLTALKPGAAGERPEVLWQNNQLRPATSSPVVAGAHVLAVNGAGILTCGSVQDGKRLWQLRLTGPFSATPIACGAHLFLVNEKGLLQVVDFRKPEGALISKLELGETILSTPAVANGALFVRSDKTLWKLGGS